MFALRGCPNAWMNMARASGRSLADFALRESQESAWSARRDTYSRAVIRGPEGLRFCPTKSAL